MKTTDSPSHLCHEHPVFGPLFPVQMTSIHPYRLLWICSQSLPFPSSGSVVLPQSSLMWGHYHTQLSLSLAFSARLEAT